jgi:hypothetical protein
LGRTPTFTGIGKLVKTPRIFSDRVKGDRSLKSNESKLHLLYFFTIVTGCSQVTSNHKECGSSTAALVTSNEFPKPTSTALGGFIYVDHFRSTDEALGIKPVTQLLHYRCTFTLDIRFGKTHIWTARHCLDRGTISSYKLYVFVSGDYHETKISIPQIERAILTQSMLRDLPQKARAFFGSNALTDAQERRATRREADSFLINECREKNESAKAFIDVSKQALCILYDDTVLLEVKIDSKTSTMIETTIPLPAKTIGVNWVQEISDVQSLRETVQVGKIRDFIEGCSIAFDWQHDEFCTLRKQLSQIFNVYFTSNVPIELMPSSSDPNPFYDSLQMQFHRKLDARLETWKSLRARIIEKGPDLQLSSNFSLGSAVSQGIETPTRFFSSALSHLLSGTSKITIQATDLGLTYKVGTNSAGLLIHSGDSGSLVSAMEEGPIAVISMVNKDATSGGASVIAIPKPKREPKAPKGEKASTTRSGTACN